MPLPTLTIIVLDGTQARHTIPATLRSGFQARILSASNVNALAQMARAAKPDIAIFGADHSADEKKAAEQLLREINPDIQIISF
jgi:hypothetical protein